MSVAEGINLFGVVECFSQVRGDTSVAICNTGLSLLGLLVGEMWGEEVVVSVIGAFFECGSIGSGKKFVEGGGMIV